MGPSGLLPFHEVGRTTLLSRFTELSEVLTCATLTNYPSTSHGAYAWVQCKEGVDCLEYLAKVNLIAEPGTQFGSTSQCKMVLHSAITQMKLVLQHYQPVMNFYQIPHNVSYLRPFHPWHYRVIDRVAKLFRTN